MLFGPSEESSVNISSDARNYAVHIMIYNIKHSPKPREDLFETLWITVDVVDDVEHLLAQT